MSQAVETRRRLLAAAEEVVQRDGVVGLTTKAVAQIAGRSEGSIYNHFSDRLELITAVIDARLPDFVAVLAELVPGRRTVAVNLERVARAGIAFEQAMLPLVAGGELIGLLVAEGSARGPVFRSGELSGTRTNKPRQCGPKEGRARRVMRTARAIVAHRSDDVKSRQRGGQAGRFWAGQDKAVRFRRLHPEGDEVLLYLKSSENGYSGWALTARSRTR